MYLQRCCLTSYCDAALLMCTCASDERAQRSLKVLAVPATTLVECMCMAKKLNKVV